MSTLTLSSNPWADYDAEENRFHRILGVIAIPFLALCILIPLYELSGLQEGGGDELSQRYAELLMEQAAKQAAEEAPPAPEPVVEEEEIAEEVVDEEPAPEVEEAPEPEPEPKPVEQPKEQPKPVEPTVKQQQARQKVQKKFAAAFNALDDLRQAPVLTSNTARPLTSASAAADDASAEPSGMITSNLASGSGGIGVAPRRTTTPTSATGLKGRSSTAVESSIGTGSGGASGVGPDKTKPGFAGDKRQQGRSLEEIQIVMDRNKSGLYSLYNRALRRDATLQGKVVLEMTIAPSGAVTVCTIVSSELNNDDLERKIINRVKLINFGAKDVSEMTIKYPIHFLPS